jgi:hypothetical protein
VEAFQGIGRSLDRSFERLSTVPLVRGMSWLLRRVFGVGVVLGACALIGGLFCAIALVVLTLIGVGNSDAQMWAAVVGAIFVVYPLAALLYVTWWEPRRGRWE